MANVVLKNIAKQFGDVVAVNDVNLEIADREFVVLVGPSGCGKTTLLRNLIPLLRQRQLRLVPEIADAQPGLVDQVADRIGAGAGLLLLEQRVFDRLLQLNDSLLKARQLLKGKITRNIEMEIEQQVGLSWSPDGSKIAFSGHRDGRFDIFEVDVASG